MPFLKKNAYALKHFSLKSKHFSLEIVSKIVTVFKTRPGRLIVCINTIKFNIQNLVMKENNTIAGEVRLSYMAWSALAKVGSIEIDAGCGLVVAFVFDVTFVDVWIELMSASIF